MKDVLLLNSSYQPIKIISWQRAIELWYIKKADIIEGYGGKPLKSAFISMAFPAVIRLKYYIKPYRKSRFIRLSRLNVYTRDNFTCLYCGKQPGTKNLTLDHVLPKSRGGAFSWQNLATACLECNYIKADMTPEEARIKLVSEPREPKIFSRNAFTVGSNCPAEWQKYIGDIIPNETRTHPEMQSNA